MRTHPTGDHEPGWNLDPRRPRASRADEAGARPTRARPRYPGSRCPEQGTRSLTQESH